MAFLTRLDINRAEVDKLRLQARILCVHTSPDVAAQYIPTMNAIFSAQQKVCRILKEDFLILS